MGKKLIFKMVKFSAPAWVHINSFRYIHMHRYSKFLVVMLIVYSELVKAHPQLKDHL